MLMVDVKDAPEKPERVEVKVQGTGGVLLAELGVLVAEMYNTITENNEEIREMVASDMMKVVAFALCSDEERDEVLKAQNGRVIV